MNPKSNIDRYLIELSEHEWDMVAFDDDGTKFTIVEFPYGTGSPGHLSKEDQETLRKMKGYIVETRPDGTSHVHTFGDTREFLDTCFYILVSKIAGLKFYHD